MKYNFKPSEITCSKEEFEVAAHLVVIKRTKGDCDAALALATSGLTTDNIDSKKVKRIALVIKKLIDELKIDAVTDTASLREKLLLALAQNDDFGYQGLARAVSQRLIEKPTEIAGIETEILDFDLEKLHTGIARINRQFIHYISDTFDTRVGHVLVYNEKELNTRRGAGPKSISILKELLKKEKGIEFPLSDEQRVLVKEYVDAYFPKK